MNVSRVTQLAYESDTKHEIGTYIAIGSDIFLLDTATQIIINLTNHPAQDSSPAWSPDGKSIAFYSTREQGTRFLYIQRPGEAARRVSTEPVRLGFRPAWSPDSSRIAYEVDIGAQTDLYIVDITRPLEANVNPIVLASHMWDDRFPAWSPDGKWLVFVSWRDGNADIFSARSDGTDMRNLTRHPGWDVNPSWSPDGTEIAFFSARERYRDLYIMDRHGENLRQITHVNELNAGFFWHAPVWSPDGTHLAIQTTVNRDPEIVVVSYDGSHQKRLTFAEKTDAQPMWLRDGEQILFVSDRIGAYGIYLSEWRSGITRRLTPIGINASYPSVWTRD